MRRKNYIRLFSVFMVAGMLLPGYASRVHAADQGLYQKEIEENEIAMEDSEELFAEYVDHKLGVSLFSEKDESEESVNLSKGYGRKKLTGFELEAYNYLKKEIARIADGRRESTIIVLPGTMTYDLDNLNLSPEEMEELKQSISEGRFWDFRKPEEPKEDCIENRPWERDEIIDYVKDMEEFKSFMEEWDYYIENYPVMKLYSCPEEAYFYEMLYNKTSTPPEYHVEPILIEEVVDPSLQKIVNYLYRDCPYEFYWYSRFSLTDFDVRLNGDSVIISNIKVNLFPNKDYGNENVSNSVDVEKTGAGTKAVAKAKSIVAEAASKSDYEKLKYYKDQICKRNSYNYEALNDMTGGDPWQLLYVFDEDKNTNVVCEGYAKAFQYLCDLTEFQNDISVLTVSGKVLYGNRNDIGGHAWNVVKMEDGKNYLVDVTFCDKDKTNSFDDDYFLVGAKEGSVDQGYISNNSSYWHVYDSYMKKLYDEEDLVLSEKDYLKKGQEQEKASSGIKAEKIKIQGISHKIAAGKKVKLKARITPTAANHKVIWSSSNKKVASVSSNGLVTMKAGSAGRSVVITAKAADGSGLCCTWKIRSMRNPVLKITGSSAKKALSAGKSMKLKVKVKARSGANKKLRWTSSNPEYATVKNGKVTAHAAGKGKTVIITAKATDGSGKKKTFKVRIK